MKKVLLFILPLMLLSTSCVTKKKFLITENGRWAAIAKADSLSETLQWSKEESNARSRTIASLVEDTTRMASSIRQYKALLNTNLSEQDKLNALLKEKLVKITELQKMIDTQNNKVKKLLQNVQDALMGFGSDELTVSQKNGKVYVAMSDKLLFQSGSANLDKRGIQALAKLAEVLNKQTDIDVYIEGHTDNKPIKTVQFKDNWDLSVVRATSVVRILTVDYQVNPLQIIPSGRGQYIPVDSNLTPEGRAKNRRTEIIMAPKLDMLLNLLQN